MPTISVPSLISYAGIFASSSVSLPTTLEPSDAAFVGAYQFAIGGEVSTDAPTYARFMDVLAGAARNQITDPEAHRRAVVIAREATRVFSTEILLGDPKTAVDRVKVSLYPPEVNKVSDESGLGFLDFNPAIAPTDKKLAKIGGFQILGDERSGRFLKGHKFSTEQSEALTKGDVVVELLPHWRYVFIPQGDNIVLARVLSNYPVLLSLSPTARAKVLCNGVDKLADYRREETDAIRSAMAMAASRGKTSVIVVAGPSGSGKDYAIEEAKKGPFERNVISHSKKFLGVFGGGRTESTEKLDVRASVTDYSTLTSDFVPLEGRVNVVTVSSLRPEDVAPMLKARNIRPDSVIYFHPKPLSHKQREEAQSRGIKTVEAFANLSNSSMETLLYFFRSPVVGSAESEKGNIRVAKDDSQILNALADMRHRHPEVQSGHSYPKSQIDNYAYAKRYFEELAKTMNISEPDMSDLMMTLLGMKDPMAPDAFKDPIAAIYAARFAFAGVLLDRPNNERYGWKDNMYTVCRRELHKRLDIWLKEFVAKYSDSFFSKGGLLMATDYERMDAVTKYLLEKIDKASLSREDQLIYDFIAKPARHLPI